MERYKEYKSSKVYWINEIPRSWQQIKISRIFHSIGSGTTPSSGDNTFYVEEGWNWLQSGDFKDNFVYDTSKKISEVAINKYGLKLYPENAIVIAMYGASIGKVGFLKIKTTVNQACCVLYDSPIMNMHYAFYSLISEKNNLIRKSKGGTQPNISQELIKGHYLAVPPLAEQEKIVSYLEDKTSKIDAYVADKEKEIELLQELKQKTIADAVTKGLNPDVKMTDYNSLITSSHPNDWKILRNKSFLTLTGEKVGNRAKEFVLLSLTTKGIIVRDLESGKGKFPKDFDSYQFVRKGELVFCLFDIDETPRTVGLVDTEGMLTGAYTAFKVNPKIALPEFVYNFFLCVDNIKALKPYYSGLRKTVRADKFLQIYIPLPPLDEQHAIVAYIEENCQKIDTLVSELQAEIDNMKEYKQRLIADCVTGQVNVQNETI